ncbi:MAG: isochorismatase family protein [Clostridiales Family XIII bacterium]|nr:isochorismatase family protein [Clostridiales Family XIII bacterium]
MGQETGVVKLNARDAALIVVDMQERLLPSIENAEAVVKACGTLIKGCRILDVPILFTQQYTKGLGGTIPDIVRAAAAETPEDADAAGLPFIDKTSFSVMGEPAFQKQWGALGKRAAILCGIEAHVCVLQSLLDLLDGGHDVFLASDAVSSRHGKDCACALQRAAGAGAVPATVESLLFELAGNARHPRFKEISRLVK